jgi:hypothetical protein
MPHPSPSQSGRYPDTVSRCIIVDNEAARLDTFAHHVTAPTIEEALHYAFDFPIDPDGPDSGGRAGWVIYLMPGTHDAPETLQLGGFGTGPIGPHKPAHHLVGHHAAGRNGQASDVVIRFDKSISAGTLVDMTGGATSTLANVKILWDGANGAAGGALTGAVDIIDVGTSSNNHHPRIENVTVEVTVNGAGNADYPVTAIAADFTGSTTSPLNISGCHLDVEHDGILPHADSRLLRAANVGAGASAVVEDCLFLNRAAGLNALTEAVTCAASGDLSFRSCEWRGWSFAGIKSIGVETSGTPELYRSVYDGEIRTSIGASIKDVTHGGVAPTATTPGVQGQVIIAGEIYRFDGGAWKEAQGITWANVT